MSLLRTYALGQLTIYVVCVSLAACTEVNVAIHKPVDQSGTLDYPEFGHLWKAETAVDGDHSCSTVSNSHYSGTAYRQKPWWQVDLGRVFNISRVRVYGKQNPTHALQYDGFELYVTTRNDTQSALNTPRHVDSSNDAFDQIHGPLVGRYVTLQVPEIITPSYGQPLVLCEVEVYVEAANVAPLANLTASTESVNYWKAKAVDGTAGDLERCDCCYRSARVTEPYFTAVFSPPRLVDFIRILGGGRGVFDVYSLSNTQVLLNGALAATNLYGGDRLLETVPTGGPISNITVVRERPGSLAICELEAYAIACVSGFYGQGCTDKCGHCGTGQSCDRESGNCTGGCAPGYQPPLCTGCVDGAYGRHCTARCGHCAMQAACNKSDGSCSGGCQPGFRGDKCETDDNLLLRIQAVTSGSPAWHNYSSGLAVDGRVPGPSAGFGSCHCCSVSAGDQPWWQLDLGTQYLIGWMEIVGRSDNPGQFANVHVVASNATYGRGPGDLLYSAAAGTVGDSTQQVLRPPRLLQYLVVLRNSSLPLTICEMRLSEAACSVGRFGDKCGRSCHCADGIGCDVRTGKCHSPGCSPGWRGPSCEQRCGHGFFGPDCAAHCHCHSNASCSRQDGACPSHDPLCSPGWKGLACDTPCEHGAFGPDCRGRCFCYNDDNCSKETGSCPVYPVCAPGWQGRACNAACPHGRFGSDCTGHCHCYNNGSCSRKNGSCSEHTPRCEVGWTGSACDIECSHGKFGVGCSQRCHCIHDGNCTQDGGICLDVRPRCAPGWHGRSCDLECVHGQFGSDCTGQCHCYMNASCHRDSGLCPAQDPLCAPGWQGPACEKVCDPGTFGIGCSRRCHCLHGENCTQSLGLCPDVQPRCAPGWQGRSCDQGHKFIDAFAINCSDYMWEISVDMATIRITYPSAVASDIYLGDNTCTGIEKDGHLLFHLELEGCLTSKTMRSGNTVYSSELVYAYHDPARPFLIRSFNWTVPVECETDTSGTANGHLYHGTETGNSSVDSRNITTDMKFYQDPNFQTEVRGNPVSLPVGSPVYVKVYTPGADWDVKMALDNCYIKPALDAPNSMKVDLIKHGCEVDANAHLLSQSAHETRLVFQQFAYTTSHEGLFLFCDAVFCDVGDVSDKCSQTCHPGS